MSVSAAFLSLFGANHRLPYHQRRMLSRTCVSLILNGNKLSGLNAWFPHTERALPSHRNCNAVRRARDQTPRWSGNLAFDGSLRQPAAFVIRNAPNRRDEIMLLDDLFACGIEFHLRGRRRAAERADERLFGGIPFRRRPARRAGEFWAMASAILLLRSYARGGTAGCHRPVTGALQCLKKPYQAMRPTKSQSRAASPNQQKRDDNLKNAISPFLAFCSEADGIKSRSGRCRQGDYRISGRKLAQRDFDPAGNAPRKARHRTVAYRRNH